MLQLPMLTEICLYDLETKHADGHIVGRKSTSIIKMNNYEL
jgi:hypothetical protein